MDYWYHGTEEYFPKWGIPPVKSKYKPELHPHPFVSITKDLALAKGASENSGGLCRSKLHEDARVLDLRVQSNDNIEHWKEVSSSEIGRHHSFAQTFDLWIQACRNGKILRFHSTNEELVSPLEKLISIAFSEAHPFNERQKAFINVQNFTRQWIDNAIMPARQLGYHAVVCSELNTDRPTGPVASLNLYVFKANMLTDPEWITLPVHSHGGKCT